MENIIEKELSKYYESKLVEEILNGLNRKKKVTLRVNNIKSNKQEIINVLKSENIEYKFVNWYDDAFVVENCLEEELQQLDIYKQGKIYMQSLSSMIPPIILNPKENENILDMAAAPGGKTTQIASISNNKAIITACERNKIRGEKLKYNIEKQSASRVNIMLEDSRNLSDFFSFDKILLDAPCSGSGTDNVFKKNFTEELIKKSSKIQETLLRKAVKILKPGGTIIYSTCSILQEENEDILNKVLKNNPNLKIEPIELSDEVPLLPTKITGTICVKPTEYFEGFFVSKIVDKHNTK